MPHVKVPPKRRGGDRDEIKKDIDKTMISYVIGLEQTRGMHPAAHPPRSCSFDGVLPFVVPDVGGTFLRQGLGCCACLQLCLGLLCGTSFFVLLWKMACLQVQRI